MPDKITETDKISAAQKITVRNTTVKENETKNLPFHKFFINALKDVYCAENATLEVLQKKQDAASSEDLK